MRLEPNFGVLYNVWGAPLYNKSCFSFKYLAVLFVIYLHEMIFVILLLRNSTYQWKTKCIFTNIYIEIYTYTLSTNRRIALVVSIFKRSVHFSVFPLFQFSSLLV